MIRDIFHKFLKYDERARNILFFSKILKIALVYISSILIFLLRKNWFQKSVKIKDCTWYYMIHFVNTIISKNDNFYRFEHEIEKEKLIFMCTHKRCVCHLSILIPFPHLRYTVEFNVAFRSVIGNSC